MTEDERFMEVAIKEAKKQENKNEYKREIDLYCNDVCRNGGANV